MSGVRHVTVAEADDGQRLDRWLKKQLPGTPFGLLQKLMRKGQVRVDGKRAKPDTRLTAGQDIRIPPVESREEKEKRKLTTEDKAYINDLVIYDDGDLVAINKPYDLPTQGGKGIYRHVDFYADGLKDKKGTAPRLVHRLDKETSGVLLMARSAKAVRALGQAFKTRKMRKYYWAITVPAPEMQDGEIHAALAQGTGAHKDRMFVNPEEGRPASTLFEVIDRAHKDAAFVCFWPRTGRKHQIRAHAEKMGTPLLGDIKYGEDSGFGADIGVTPRLHLHAQRLSFQHPISGKVMDILAPLPPELHKSWSALGFDPVYKDDPFADIGLL